MPMSRSLVPALAVSAILGAAVAVGAVELFDLGGGTSSTTTVVQQPPLSAQQEKSSGAAGSGLTARDIYKRDAPGVVFIRAEVVEPASSPFDFGQQQQGEATGSGFVIGKDGTILTNAHVVENARRVRVQFADQRVETATIVGRDRSTDLAVLKVDPDGLELHPLALGSSRSVQVGDPTVAIGNPFGLERTLTTGVVSATKRTIPGARQLPDRQRDPDGRRDQPRQLRRPADRRGRARDRDQLADPHGRQRQRQRRDRLRGADRHGQAHRAPARAQRQGRARLPRRRSRARSTARWPTSTCRPPAARWCRP